MLDTDIFLNILKYLNTDQWHCYINMNKELKYNLLKKSELIKKYFKKKTLPLEQRLKLIIYELTIMEKRLENIEKKN